MYVSPRSLHSATASRLDNFFLNLCELRLLQRNHNSMYFQSTSQSGEQRKTDWNRIGTCYMNLWINMLVLHKLGYLALWWLLSLFCQFFVWGDYILYIMEEFPIHASTYIHTCTLYITCKRSEWQMSLTLCWAFPRFVFLFNLWIIKLFKELFYTDMIK